jgi:cellulose synthase operon protein YhjQ
MSISTDIANLYALFGGRPEQYQEFHTSGASLPGGGVAALGSSPVEHPHSCAADAIQAQPSWSAAELPGLAKAPSSPVSQSIPALDHLCVLAVVSAKGGVGKSTLAANLAAALHQAGRAVLALDLDPQNALHQHFLPAGGLASNDSTVGLSLSQGVHGACGMLSRAGVWVLPYGWVDDDRRQVFEGELAADPLWLARLLEGRDLPQGTVVVIDTPPGPSLYLRQALSVANRALVVSLADAASHTSLPQIERLISRYTAGSDSFAGTAHVINQVDDSAQLSTDIRRTMQGLFGPQLVGTVHREASISEALAHHRTLFEHDPQGRGCTEINDCAQALAGLLNIRPRVEQPA